MIACQKADLDLLGVRFDRWFSESDLYVDGRVTRAVDEMRAAGHTYEKDGALWLRSTDFGDDRDRVLIRADQTPTYIAGDAAYHKDKFDRGFTRIINVWGADHAGYVARTKAAVAALGYDPDALHVVLYRPLRVVREGEIVYPSQRAGDVLELRADLIDEIGVDATRFFCLTRPSGDDLDLDLDLAKRADRENALHRIREALSLTARFVDPECVQGNSSAGAVNASETYLVANLSEFPAVVASAAREYAPHLLARYAIDLADQIIRVYGAGAEAEEDHSPLKAAARTTLSNVMALMGVGASNTPQSVRS
jgi:arginyl-tRNA synthetase